MTWENNDAVERHGTKWRLRRVNIPYERKSEQAHIPHAPTLLENAV